MAVTLTLTLGPVVSEEFEGDTAYVIASAMYRYKTHGVPSEDSAK